MSPTNHSLLVQVLLGNRFNSGCMWGRGLGVKRLRVIAKVDEAMTKRGCRGETAARGKKAGMG